jgi:3-hydroxybutyryl-CoA dehydrogenase
MLGINDAECERGMNTVKANFAAMAKARLITQKQIDASMKLLMITQRYEDMHEARFLVEAVLERIDIKHSVYRQLDKFVPGAKVLTSVTSAISVNELADGAAFKERLLVAHPWNPPHMIPNVEVVRSKYTSDVAMKAALEFFEYLGRKVVVLNKDIEGFIGNRIMHAMYREALYLIEQGIASAEEIDKVVYYSFGQRFSSVGLLEYFDSCGLDLHVDVETYLFPTLCCATGPQKIVLDNVEKGNLGMKTGQGIFDWSEKNTDDFMLRKERPFYQYVNWHFPE